MGLKTMIGIAALAAMPCGAFAEGCALSSPDITDVTVTGGFWLPRLETNRAVTVQSDLKRCEETGRLANFRLAGERAGKGFRGIPYDDSDVFKVIEGAAYILATHPDKALEAQIDAIIADIAKAQEPDGYLYTARTLGYKKGEKGGKTDYGRMGAERWSNLLFSHELYNVGHLYEAAVAWFEATGKRNLLDVAVKSADLVDRTFGPRPEQLKNAPGHEEIELALCKLYKATGEKRYLQLARHFLGQRGFDTTGRTSLVFTPDGDLVEGDATTAKGAHFQNHVPVLEQREAVGHAVRATYLYCGMADIAALTADTDYLKATDRLWENVVGRKLALNGSVGARHKGESFGANYELPNETAYLETCAGIGNALWNWRMFLLHGDAKYIDVMERALYNGIASGVSLSGDEFFYPNPLASQGGYRRSKWFKTSCCPVNVVRFFPQIPQLAYARSGDSAYVNLFMASAATLKLKSGEVKLSQQTDYPWSGAVRIGIDGIAANGAPRSTLHFQLAIRIPGWCVGRPVPSDLYGQVVPGTLADFALKVNGEAVKVAPVKGYCVITRDWQRGDTVEVAMNMPVRRIKAHDKVEADKGRLAVERGPIVYCAEGADNAGKAFDAVIPADATFADGTVEIGGRTFPSLQSSNGVTLIPYCLWDNREPGNEMQTWFATKKKDMIEQGAYTTVALPSPGDSLPAGGKSQLDEIAARLKPLRTWALPYAAGVPCEAFVSRKVPPKIGPTGEGQAWTKLSVEKFFPFIDKYGQFIHKDWPDKVHSDADFAVQREREEKDLAAHPGPKGWDKWGGWADGPQLEKKGGFYTTKWNGKWWIVDPDGHLWWSHGPVRVLPSSAMTPLATPNGDRAGWFQELPAKDDPVFGAFYETRDVLLWPYYGKRGIDKVYDFSAANIRRKYGENWFAVWADLAHRRLRSWSCNTIANSSDKRICLMDRTPYTERFEIHARPIAGHKGGWWEFCDPFDPSFRAEARRMTEVYKAEIDDPWCMGFFVDNEHKWGKPHTFGLSTLKSPAGQPCKAVFRDRLKAKYGTAEKLNAAWQTAYADWDAFMSETEEPKKLDGALGDLEAFSAEIADAYFRIIREELKRANPGKLYLGCRWAQTAPAFVVRAAANYCDVLSYNIYAKDLRDFKLPDGVDAPVLIGEFHFGALDRGPFCPGLILLRDQRERAETYKDYVRSALEHPQFVGVHWHQFSDQATSGRFDGENMQVGWTDVCDTPYWETVEAVRDMGSQMYTIRANATLSGAADVKVSVEPVFYDNGIVRIVKRPGAPQPLCESFSVVARPGCVSVAVSESDGAKTYATSALMVVVDAEGKVTFKTPSGDALLAEEDASFRKRAADDPDSGSFDVRQSWRLAADEPVYGLGIWQDEQISRRGRRRKMMQNNVDDYVPIVQSVKGYGIFWDNASPTVFEEKDGVMSFNSEVADAADYYFLYGKTSDGVVRLIRRLTGEVPMQPKWTLGYYISRERYKSWAECIAVVDEHRRRGIPLDTIVQDWQYWGDSKNWNAMDFLNPLFAGPEQNIAVLHDRHVKVMISVWPSFGTNTQQYARFAAKDLLLKGGYDTWPHGNGVRIYDAYSAEARDIYWNGLKRLRDCGVDAWWMDATEPYHHKIQKSAFDAPTAEGSFRRVFNAYPLYTVNGVYEHQRDDEKGRRRVSIMTRSAFAGQQRTGANTWSGDTKASWENFRKNIAAGIGFGLTGNPNYNTDIGGFFVGGFNKFEGGATKNPAFAELMVRWMQYAVFNPIFRSHGTGVPREIWQFGDKGDAAYDAMLDCIKLRYRLLPYLYSTARWVSAKGGTMMRPVFAEYAFDRETWNLPDEFLFGTELLAAPVDSEKATSRRLYLPKGAWYGFFGGERVEGGRWIERPVTLSSIPLYAKAGAIVPFGPDMQYVDQVENPQIDILVFPGADGVFTLYDDAGDGYGYEKGECAEIPFAWNDKTRTLAIGARKGAYPGMEKKRKFTVCLVGGSSKTVEYDGGAVQMAFP